MRILLTAAGTPPHSGRPSLLVPIVEYITPRVSLTLLQLAALTPRDHDVRIVDENNGQTLDFNLDVDLVGITAFTKHAIRAYEIADRFRARGVKVVIGGYHASALPEEAMAHADAVVVGEAEASWHEVLRDAEQGSLKRLYRPEKGVDPCMIPPALSVKIGKKRVGAGNVQASRGCPFQCEFCSVTKVEGHRFRARPIENVISEIKALPTRFFTFNDASLTIDLEYTKDLFRSMRGLGKRFRCFGNINQLHDDEELVRLSREAGCLAWHIGFESISQDSLQTVHKVNNIRFYEEGIKRIKAERVGIKGLFMFGFDRDSPRVFSDTYKAVRDWHLDASDFSILTPYPGTVVFQRFEQEGRILTRDWSKYNLGNVVFIPKLMSPTELYEGTRRIANAYHSGPLLARRMLRNDGVDLVSIGEKFLANLWDTKISRKEQGF